MGRHHVNLHLISDATGETLIAASRAVAAQYHGVCAIEHVYPMVRSHAELEKAIVEIEAEPGIVLFTLVDQDLARRLMEACAAIGAPSLSILAPIMSLFESYIGTAVTPRPGAQHSLNADYFRRMDALNYTMTHDDGLQSESYEAADVVLMGVSRTSKTPTSIYLANRGVKTANLPFVPDMPLPKSVENLRNPLIVGLLASPDRIVQIRANRLLTMNSDPESPYVDRRLVAEEVAQSKKLFDARGWPTIDVTRRSIEETAAAIIGLHKLHKMKFISAA
ncbi:pyruvate, water dikinase regulatory protein [Methylocella silvestris]|uniref:Putative pyruvate, phosphate dikinase regulatory protein n=1 Tax=Methylocella silvestris TaxID=199596 RepID=A0A2J7TF75_METSI|nr:pyruvate, water dikinase regulatory protein [Methylocella silvestris]PNG25393.1 phosphoenolpyruvate synthase regulatory protein [Methylocella silvestris]